MKWQQQLWLPSTNDLQQKKNNNNNTNEKIHLGNSCWNSEPTTLTATNSSSQTSSTAKSEKKSSKTAFFHIMRNVQTAIYALSVRFFFSVHFFLRHNNVMNHFYDLSKISILCPRIMIVIRQMVLVQFYAQFLRFLFRSKNICRNLVKFFHILVFDFLLCFMQ